MNESAEKLEIFKKGKVCIRCGRKTGIYQEPYSRTPWFNIYCPGCDTSYGFDFTEDEFTLHEINRTKEDIEEEWVRTSEITFSKFLKVIQA